MSLLLILFILHVALVISYAWKALELKKLQFCIPDGDQLQTEDIGVGTGDICVQMFMIMAILILKVEGSTVIN